MLLLFGFDEWEIGWIFISCCETSSVLDPSCISMDASCHSFTNTQLTNKVLWSICGFLQLGRRKLPLWKYGISKLFKVKASPKKTLLLLDIWDPSLNKYHSTFLWKSWKRFRSGLNLRERVDKKETSRKFCYKLVMRYTELRLTFDSSLNILVQYSVIPVIEMTS